MRAGDLIAVLCLVAGAAACDGARPTGTGRATVLRQGPALFQVVPGPEQFPHCLVFTVSERTVTRQLTMSRDNTSFDCPPGKPVGNRTFRAPVEEGPVRVLVFFSTQKLNAAALAQQLIELPEPSRVSLMDLRLPGGAALDTLEFVPLPDMPVEVGGVVGADAGTP